MHRFGSPLSRVKTSSRVSLTGCFRLARCSWGRDSNANGPDESEPLASQTERSWRALPATVHGRVSRGKRDANGFT